MTTRDIPPEVADALRGVHRLVAQRRPVEEVTVALDAAAALPEAADPVVADLIALERNEAEERYEEREPPPEALSGSVGTFPRELVEGIRYAYRHHRMGWPYEDVMAILDEVAVLPAAKLFSNQVSFDRIMIARQYDRPDEDLEREIERALRTSAGPAWSRASTIMLACDDRPALAKRYMPRLIKEAEEELRQRPDEVAQKSLDGVKARLESTRAK